jgi:hypothetical protein
MVTTSSPRRRPSVAPPTADNQPNPQRSADDDRGPTGEVQQGTGSDTDVSRPPSAELPALFGWQKAEQNPVEHDAGGVGRSVRSRGMGDEEGGLLDGSGQHVRQLANRLRLDGAGVHGAAEDGLDRGNAVGRLDRSSGLPSEDGGPVEQHDLLDLHVQGGGEHAVEAVDQPLPGVTGRRVSDGPQDKILLDLLVDDPEELRLVSKVVVEGTAGTDSGVGDDVADAGREKPGVGEQCSGRVDDLTAGLIAPRPSLFLPSSSFCHGPTLATCNV